MAKPKIRFNGYTEDWEQRELSEIALQTYGGGTPKTANEEFWKGNIPWIQSSDLIEERLFNVKPRKYISQEAISKSSTKLVPQNSVAIVTRVGVGKLVFMPFSYATSQDFLSLSELKIEPKFAVYALYKMMRLVSNEVQGTSIKGITKDELLAKEFLIPDGEEQKKIGVYLHNLDHLITLHQRKCEQTKTLKKYMLQKMFPQDGEKVPQIRFEGFTEDWEQRKVLDLLIQPITDGPHETPKLVEEGVPFISVDAIVDNKIDFNRKRGNISEEYDELCCKKYKPQFHDVYLVKSGSTVGKVAIVETTDRFNIWSPLAAMRCGEKTYPYFLYDLLQTKDLQAQVADKASNGTQPNLSMRELEKFPVSVPSNLEEQKKIGDYFRNLDHLITLHQRKCDELKEVKKFMLQNMFV